MCVPLSSPPFVVRAVGIVVVDVAVGVVAVVVVVVVVVGGWLVGLGH